jgi:FKBP-type peptidyl-prolyl cis-trans isomerase
VSPKPTDRVEIHYTGRKPDGNVFDSSVERGKTMVHSASGFVPGFNEAIAMMKVGGKCRIVIPGKLAYGEGPETPGGQPKGTLVFDLELIAIK